MFNELVDAEPKGLNLAYMIDQSHNVTDPIESLMASAIEIARAYVQASLVDRSALAAAQGLLVDRSARQACLGWRVYPTA